MIYICNSCKRDFKLDINQWCPYCKSGFFTKTERTEMTDEKTKGKKMRTFHTGATRNSDDSKLDFEGFLSPLVIKRYAEYLHKHRIQADGKIRESDNWQKGIPLSVYAKSLWRHLVSFWTCHRYPALDDIDIMEDALCAIIFNASGYLYELETIKLPDPDPAENSNPLAFDPYAPVEPYDSTKIHGISFWLKDAPSQGKNCQDCLQVHCPPYACENCTVIPEEFTNNAT